MLKNIFWALVMVTIAACAVLLGEGFTPPFPSPTATAVIDQTEIPFPTEIIVPTTEITEVVPTATEIVIPPTATSVPPTVVPPTVVPPTATFTSTAIPPTATFTPTAVPPTATVAPTAITEKFTLQAATPIFMINFAHTILGCNWQGVAGQVFDAYWKSINQLRCQSCRHLQRPTVQPDWCHGHGSGRPVWHWRLRDRAGIFSDSLSGFADHPVI